MHFRQGRGAQCQVCGKSFTRIYYTKATHRPGLVCYKTI